MRAAELGFGGLNRKQIEIRNERERVCVRSSEHESSIVERYRTIASILNTLDLFATL